MNYTAYLSDTSGSFREVRKRSTEQMRMDFALQLTPQLEKASNTLSVPSGVEAEGVTNISVAVNEASALFTISDSTSAIIYVLAQSGYVTGLKNDADLEMYSRLQALLREAGELWEPPTEMAFGPPCYLVIVEQPTSLGLTASSIFDRVFPLAETLALAFFCTIQLDGPDAYEWDTSDDAEDDD